MSSFVIQNGVLEKYLGDEAHVVVPEEVTIIGEDAFYDCQNMVSITLPKGIQSIGSGAFGYCCNLEEIVLSEELKAIGNGAFRGSGVKRITWPKGLQTIGNSAFYWCSGLTSVALPEGLEVIGDRAFYYCSNLMNIVLPKSLRSIGKNAFSECGRLRRITLPEGLQSIGEGAIKGIIQVNSTGGQFVSEKELIIDTEDKKVIWCSPNGVKIDVPDGVVSIGADVFSGCVDLMNIMLPESLQSIEANAFSGCMKLSGIVFPKGLLRIGENAFAGCKMLKDVVLPDNLIEVGKEAFARCDDKLIIRSGEKVFAALDKEVRERTILKWMQGKLKCTPNQEKPMVKYVNRTRDAWVKRIKGDKADMLAKILSCGKAKLEQIDAYIEKANDGKHPMMLALLLDYKQKNFAQDAIALAEDQKMGFAERSAKDWEKAFRLKKDEIGYVLVKYKGIDKQPEIPAEIEGTPVYAIANNAFKGNESIEEIEVPGSIQTIGDSAFEKCIHLKTIRFHEGLKHVGKRAFYHCENIAGELILPEGLLTNGVNAFDFGRNEKIKAIHFPQSMEAFTGSLGLDAYPDLYFYGLHTQVEYGLLCDPITIHVRKNSEAYDVLSAFEKAVGGHNGKIEYIDEGKFPTNVK